MLFQILLLLISFSSAQDKCFGISELSSVLSKSYKETEAVQGCFYSEVLREKVLVEVTIPKGYPFPEPIPTVYFLHGRGSNGEHFKRIQGVQALDEHLGKGGKPMLVVSPSETMHSYWKDRADGKADMATMLTKDLTKYIEMHGRSRILQGPAHRGIAGVSMGGHGALYLGCRNQGYDFARIHAISPVIRDFDKLKEADVPVFVGAKDPRNILGQQREFNKRDPRFYYTSVYPGGPKDFFCNYQIDYARGDALITRQTRTHEFLEEIKATHPERVKVAPGGVHGGLHWVRCLPNMLKGMEESLYPPATRQLSCTAENCPEETHM